MIFLPISLSTNLNPTSDIQKSEIAFLNRQSLHFKVSAVGSDPSNSEVWINRPGRITTHTTWLSNKERRLTSWQLAVNGSNLVGYDPIRHWTFQTQGNSHKEKIQLLKKFESSIPECVVLLLSPGKMETFFKPFEASSPVWTKKDSGGEITWTFNKDSFHFQMSFLKSNGFLASVGAHSIKPALNYEWRYSYQSAAKAPSLKIPKNVILTDKVSFARPIPNFNDPKVNSLVKGCFETYGKWGKAKVSILTNQSPVTIWRDGAKVWQVNKNGDGFWWDGSKIHIRATGKSLTKKLTLSDLPDLLNKFSISLDPLTRAYLGGHNFAARIFLPSAAAKSEGDLVVGKSYLSLVSLKFHDLWLDLQIDTQKHFITSISRRAFNDNGNTVGQDTKYVLEEWSNPPSFK